MYNAIITHLENAEIALGFSEPSSIPLEKQEAARTMRDEVNHYRSSLHNSERYVRQFAEELERTEAAIEAAKKAGKQDLATAFLAQVRKDKRIVGIWPRNGRIFFQTRPMSKILRRRRVNLGSYLIVLNPAYYKPEVLSLDYWLRNYEHPHVEKGQCCLGSYQGDLRMFFAKRELYQWLDTILLFLVGYSSSGSPFVNEDEWFTERHKKSKALQMATVAQGTYLRSEDIGENQRGEILSDNGEEETDWSEE